MQLIIKKMTFLANTANKQQFINVVSDLLEKNGCQVHHASADAEVLIVQKAVESATISDTVLVGDDTDHILLLYHTRAAVKGKLGSQVCTQILFLHPVLGCATTSHLHGIGKG